jgi:hypothetical protein
MYNNNHIQGNTNNNNHIKGNTNNDIQYTLPPIEYNPSQNNEINKQNIGFAYRQNILDKTMQHNGNVLFEQFPTATRLNENHSQKSKLFEQNNNYYLTNRITLNSQQKTYQEQNTHQQVNVVCDIIPQYTRNNELEKKSNKYYEPKFSPSASPLPFMTNSNDIANSTHFMNNTRSKSSIDMQPYTPNPMASNIPINTTSKNPHIPEGILSVDTRSNNYSNGTRKIV